MEEKSLSFKNVVNGDFALTSNASVLSLIKTQQKNQEQFFFLLEQTDGKHIYLYQTQLTPQAKSNQATLLFQPISFSELKKITAKASCKTWNLSSEKLALLKNTIASQTVFTEYEALLELIQLPTGQWKTLTLNTRNTDMIREKPFDGSSSPVANSSSKFFALPSGADNKNILTFVKYGEESLQNKQFEKALKQFNEALKLDPHYAVAKKGKAKVLFELGVLAYNQEDYAQAQEYFQNTVNLAPDQKIFAEALLLAQQKLTPQARALLATKKQFPNPIENLIFQGGGIKGLAYVGSLAELLSGDYEFSLEQIKRVGGTSAGAITVLGLGLGYSIDEIKKIMLETLFSNFFDGEYRDVFLKLNERSEEIGKKFKETSQGSTVSIISGAASAYSSDKDVAAIKQGISLLQEKGFGLFAGERLRNWFEELIRLKTGGVKKADGTIEGGLEHATFQELRELQQKDPEKYKYFKPIYFVGVNLTLTQVEVFSHEHTPDVIVSDALRCSMSIPFVFKAHQVYIKNAATGFKRQLDAKKHLYIDGGVLSNLPIWLFDKADYVPGCLQTGHQINPHTLAFMLTSPEKYAHHEQNTRWANEIPEGLGGYVKQIIECIYENSERQIPTIDNRQRTIFVDNKGVNTTEFNLTPFKRDLLLLSGQQSVSAYFTRVAQAPKIEKPLIPLTYFAYLNPVQQDAEGNTLLHTAVKQADWSLVRYLCTERIAMIDKAARNQAGETVMDLAIKQIVSPSQTDILALLASLDFPKTTAPMPTM